jgi:beta-glucosidase
VTRPTKELRGFERVALKRGETKTVRFQVGPSELQFYDRQMKRTVEPGTFKIMVGPDSVQLKEAVLTVTRP